MFNGQHPIIRRAAGEHQRKGRKRRKRNASAERKNGGGRSGAKRREVAGREDGFMRKLARRIKPTSRRKGPDPRPFHFPVPELPVPLTALCPKPTLKPVEQYHDMHKADLKSV